MLLLHVQVNHKLKSGMAQHNLVLTATLLVKFSVNQIFTVHNSGTTRPRLRNKHQNYPLSLHHFAKILENLRC